MKDKILCLSWCDADDVMNYGQILQACAMMSILRSYSDGRISYVSYRRRNLKSRIKRFITHIDPRSGHLNAYIRTSRLIRRFVKANHISFHQVFDEKNIEKYSNDARLMICGSDQIWHPQNYDRCYFLKFGEPDVKRVAFAASLPKSKREAQFLDVYKMMEGVLPSFDAIAVREKRSIDLLRSLSGKEVVDVSDPTYLLPRSEWESQIERIETPENYIFVYIPNGMNEDMLHFVESIKAELRVQNVLVMITRGKNLFHDTVNLRYVSVGQFLYLIKNAAAVVTSSFHAVVFSTIFQKEFWCYDVPNPNRGEDCRLEDLLDKLQIQERLIRDGSFCSAGTIDYDRVAQLIDREAQRSRDFLSSVLR